MRIPLTSVLLLFVASTAVAETEGLSFEDALLKGEGGLALRYRYEHVEQDGFTEQANASTLRLRR